MAPRHQAALVALVTTWAASFLFVDRAVREVSPMILAFFRFTVASVLFAAVGTVGAIGGGGPGEAGGNYDDEGSRDHGPPTRDRLLLLAASAFGVGLFFPAQYTAVLVPALLVCLLSPILIAIFGSLKLGERFPATKVAGILVGAAGAAFVVTGGRSPSLDVGAPAFVGGLLALSTPFMWAAYSACSKVFSSSWGSAKFTARVTYLGTAILGIVTLLTGAWRGVTSEDLARPSFLGAVAYLSIGCSALGYTTWNWSMKHLEASRVGAFLYIEPFITVLLAFAFLGEVPPPVTLVGGLLTLAGVLLVSRSALVDADEDHAEQVDHGRDPEGDHAERQDGLPVQNDAQAEEEHPHQSARALLPNDSSRLLDQHDVEEEHHAEKDRRGHLRDL